MSTPADAVPVAAASTVDSPRPVEAVEEIGSGRPEGRGLREHTARGVLVNSAFNVGIAALLMLRRLLPAAYLTATDYGLWGILVVALSTLLFLKDIGIGDKYVQQREADQELAFHKAFTIEAMLTGIFFVLCLAMLPVFAVLYGTSQILLPGAILSLALPLSLLGFPRMIFYRRMQFGRQRALEAVDPVVGLLVTLGLAIAGFGYWSLIIGQLVAVTAAGIVTQLWSPYRMRFRYDRGTLRSYFSFSWPLFVSQGTNMATVQATTIAGKASVGLSGLGTIGFAGNLSQFADGVDGIVTTTMYPALCARADDMKVMHESFVKSNRLALMWGMPFGLALALFAPFLVHHLFGSHWTEAIPVVQMTGVTVAIAQIGYNWTAFMRARGETRGLAVVSTGGLIASLVLTVPPLIIWGLDGFIWGSLAKAIVLLVLRGHYLRAMFRGFSIARHCVRAIAPSLPAVAVVLGLQRLHGGDSPGYSLLQFVVYLALTVGATWLLERDLLREMGGYLRRALPHRPAPVT